MDRDEIVRFLDRWVEAWARRDATELAIQFAADAVVESPSARTVRGRQAIAQSYLGALFEAFPDLELVPDELIIDDGGRVALAFTSTGTHCGDFLGIAPTRKRFEIRGVMLIILKASRIVTMRVVYDFTGLLLTIGILKASRGQ